MKRPLSALCLLFCLRIAAQPILIPDEVPAPQQLPSDIPGDIMAKVDPSVVSIQHERAVGTGFILTEDGYILTNGHVVRGSDAEDPTLPAQSITVVLNDERKFSATVLGFSMDPDVALLKINAGGPLHPVELADSRKVSIGQRCFAVGTPSGLRRTFTSGILSNIDRTDLGTETSVIQTDAAINPGNSGGPLFDQQGRVLGINTYASRGANNLGFTIPIHVAMDMVDDFKTHGSFVRTLLPLYFTGELYDELARALDVERGILISFVLEGSEAWDAGLRAGDVLVDVDGEPVGARTRAELLDFEWRQTIRPAGETVRMRLLRGQGEAREELTVEAELQELDLLPEFGRHAGEIPEYRYAALGLGVKSTVMLHQIIHEIPDTAGVLVKFAEDNSPASKADIQPYDILTHVAGERVRNLSEFRTVFEAALAKRTPAIEIRLTRRKLELLTALAPDYPMQSRHVALISAAEHHEFVDLMRRELLALGAEVRLVTPGKQPLRNDLLERPLSADLSLEELDVNDFDVILFAGGEGSRAFWDDEQALRIARDALETGRHFAAAGPAALLPVLASEEPLTEKMTLPREDSAEAVRRNATYTGKEVESDGRIHTTTALDRKTVREFLTTVHQASLRTPVR